MSALYDTLLGQTSAMKLSAPRLRAAGGDGPIEAAIVLHEAERIEARALGALGAVDAMTRFRSAIERCALLVEARDPTTVLHERWPDVWLLSETVPAEVVTPALRRLRPAVEALRDEHRAVVAKHPALTRTARAASIEGRAGLVKTYSALRAYVGVFPGDWGGWQGVAQVAHALRRWDEAWRAVQIARRFDPGDEDEGGRALEVNIATDALATDALRPWLDRAAADLFRDGRSAGMALAIAGAYATLARKMTAERAELLSRADAALSRCEALLRGSVDAELRRYVRAMRMALQELRAGREPTELILDRAGLPELHALLDRHDHDTVATLRGRAAEIRGLAA